MDIIIKEADENNVDEANKMLTDLIRDESNYDSNIDKKYKVNHYYENRKNNTKLLFDYDGEKIAGYVFGIIDKSEAYINNKLLIDALFVKEEYRKNGIAKKLLNSIEKWGKENNAKIAELTVCKENEKALSLYNSLGFETIVYRMNKKIQ